MEGRRPSTSDSDKGVPFPIIHEKSSKPLTNGDHGQNKESEDLDVNNKFHQPVVEPGSDISMSSHEQLSPHLFSDTSEADKEYQQFMGKMIPEFIPKKQAQFRPISAEPTSDSELDLEASGVTVKSPPNKKQISSGPVAPGMFHPVISGTKGQTQGQPGGKSHVLAMNDGYFTNRLTLSM